MEVTADTLINQVANLFLSKIDKQNIDPNFLQKFMDSILNKISIKGEPYKQAPPTEKSSIVEDIKKAYKELLRDETYKNEYKKFLAEVLPFDLSTKLKDVPVSKIVNLPTKTNTVLETATKTEQKTSEGRTKLIEDKPKVQEVILAGFTERGSRALKDKFANIFKGFFDKLKGFFDKLQGPKGGFGILGGALALLLGGLSALVAGIMTDGPFKGFLKILSKVGIQGALKTLEIAAKFFMSGLKSAIMSPIDLLKGAAKAIGQVFGKGAFKTLIKPIRSFSGFFTKILGSFGRFFSKAFLTKIPLIGSLISFGFAFSRFKSGDVIGGLIDVVSGLVPLLYLTGVGAPFVIPIQLGLDMLNAILDYKAGGADKKASAKKGGILLGWLKGIGSLLYRGIKSLPIIGPAIKAVEEFSAGNFGKGLKQLAYIATPLEFIGALLGDKEASGLTKTTASVFRGIGSVLLSLGKWIAKTLYKVLINIPIIGPAIKAIEEFSAGNFGKGLKQLVYIFPPFEMLGALLGDEEVGAVSGGIVSTTKSIGSLLLSLGKWIAKTLPKVLKNTLIIGPLIKAIENFSSGNYLKGLKQLAYIFPPFEILGALLGDTEVTGMASFSGSILKSTGQTIANLWTWIKDTLWEKISGFVTNLINGFKDWWKNLSWVPRSWFGENITPEDQILAKQQKADKIKKRIDEYEANPEDNPFTGLEISNLKNDPAYLEFHGKKEDMSSAVPLADSSVVTRPINTIVEEASSEVVTPLEKYFDPQQLTLNNSTLKEIASNTNNTNNSLKILSDALFKLVTVLDKKTGQGSTTIINSTGQVTQKTTPASVIANTNVDPIRRVRMQFA